MATRSEHQTVPLSVLLKRELANERIECPELVHGQAYQSKKGEDFTLIKTERQRVLGDGVSTYSVFGLFDGHNGSAAAIYSKENLLSNVLSAIPSDLNRDEWVAALPRALVAGFVKTDKDFQEKAQTSGTTVTFVIIEGWVVTVASVGDSRCILEPAEGGVYYLSADHRLECNEEERDRITASGGEVGRLNTGGGAEIGPLRCWPGGLCLSRSIGDMDVGEFIVPVPYVKQVKRSSSWLKMMSVSLASGLFLVVISALGQLGLPHLSKGGRYPVEHRPLPSSEVDCALIQSPDARELEDFCVSIVKKIKDAFGWAGDIRTETRIGAWTGELPSYLRMVGEADSNIEGISTAPSEKIDTDMRISAHDIASYQACFHICMVLILKVHWRLLVGSMGAVSGMSSGKGYVDVSTVDGATSKLISGRINATGASFLEAPVSGSKKPAEDGQPIFLTAGDKSLYELVAPLLDIMGKSRFYLGDVGNGAAMKLVVNMIMGRLACFPSVYCACQSSPV